MATNDIIATPWLIFKDAIQKILLDNKAFTNYNIPELFQCTFKMANDSQSDNLYNGLMDLITEHLENNVRGMIVNISNDSMLHMLCNIWDDFQSSIDSISRILIYFEGFNVKINPRNQNISKMSNGLFSNLIVYYASILDTIRKQLFQMLRDERDSKTVDREEIKKILTIMMSLESAPDRPTSVTEIPTVYNIEFKPTVLDHFSSFFDAEGKKLVKTSANAMAYINSAESLIAREEVRIKYYFDEKTQIQLASIINIKLVQLHMDAIVEMKNNDIKFMIENNEFENLTHMYNFLNRVANGLKPMITHINVYVCELGKLTVRDRNKNATDIIREVINLNTTCNNLLVNCFNNDLRFKCAFTKSFEYIMRLNPMTSKYLVVLVIDGLRKILLSFETTHGDTLVIEALKMYNYLHDKDHFNNSLKNFIARILFLNFAKDTTLTNTELRVFSLLEDNCSQEFKTGVDNMTNDFNTQSKTTMVEFKQHVVQYKNNLLTSVDHFNPLLLNKAYWPIFEKIPCNLPLELSTIYDSFKEFYKEKYNKQLTLLPNYGLIDIKAVFCDPKRFNDKSLASVSPKEYIIQSSTFQSCVLLLFNNSDQLSLETIMKETNISKNTLIPVLQSLVLASPPESNVLLKNPKCSKIELTDKFYVNEAFTSSTKIIKMYCLPFTFTNIAMNNETVDQNRDKLIESSIIRLMRLKTGMTQTGLIKEVEKANIKLKPTEAIINKQIDILIEKKIIKRSTLEPQVLMYIA